MFLQKEVPFNQPISIQLTKVLCMICKLLVAQFEIYSEEDIFNPQDNDKILSIDINS